MKKFQPFLLIIFCMVRCASAEDEHFVNTFAVSLRDDVQNADDVVQDIASSLGFTVEHKVHQSNSIASQVIKCFTVSEVIRFPGKLTVRLYFRNWNAN